MMSETRMHAISVLICAFAAASVSCEASGEDVNQLTVSDFDGALQEHSFILVEFYVPWCGHSRRLFPELVKAAAHLRGNVAVARVDCSKEPGLAQRFHVRLHPTLKLFVAGFPVDYRGKGTARAIVDYCEAMMLPSVTQLSTVKSTLDFVAQNDLVLLAFYACPFPPCGDFFTISSRILSALEYPDASLVSVSAKQSCQASEWSSCL